MVWLIFAISITEIDAMSLLGSAERQVVVRYHTRSWLAEGLHDPSETIVHFDH
jgi:hypothetical protein